MPNKGLLSLLLLLLITFTTSSCVPKTFVRTYEVPWISIDMKNVIDSEQIWRNLVDKLTERFALDLISEKKRFIRTSWISTQLKVGQYDSEYKVRAIVEFLPDSEKINIKTEACYLTKDHQVEGFDKYLLQTVKADIMNIISYPTK